MKVSVLITKPGQWRLYRDVPAVLMSQLEDEGWSIQASWLGPVSRSVVVAAAREISL